MTTKDSFGRLRDLFFRPPSISTFKAIRNLVDEAKAEESQILFDYAQEHLESWPIHLRSVHYSSERTRSWGLGRTFDCSGMRLEEDDLPENGSQFRGFDFSRLSLGYDPDVLIDVFHYHVVQNAEFLDLRGNSLDRLSGAWTQGLSLSDFDVSFPNLKTLLLGWNRIGIIGFIELIRSQEFPKLERLGLNGCSLGDIDFFENVDLSQFKPAFELKALALSDNGLDCVGFDGIKDTGIFNGLEELYLGANPLEFSTFFELSTSEEFESLRVLELSASALGMETALELIGGSEILRGLERLSLVENLSSDFRKERTHPDMVQKFLDTMPSLKEFRFRPDDRESPEWDELRNNPVAVFA